MVTVNARYGFKEPRTRAIQRPRNPLEEAFKRWMDTVPEQYLPLFRSLDDVEWGITKYAVDFSESAHKCLEGIDIRRFNYQDVNALVLQYSQDPRMCNVGLFLTACYGLLNEAGSVFDVETDVPIGYLGHRLPENKTLIIKTDVGANTGNDTGGTIVSHNSVIGDLGCWRNYGTLVSFGKTRNIGSFMIGRILNYGETSTNFGHSSVNFGDVMRYMCSRFSANFGRTKELSSGHSSVKDTNSVMANFGQARRIINVDGYLCINTGESEETHSDGNVGFTLKGETNGQGDIIFIDSGNKRLMDYIERVKGEIGKYRDAKFPDCLGVFEVLQKELGNRKSLEAKLRGLL